MRERLTHDHVMKCVAHEQYRACGAESVRRSPVLHIDVLDLSIIRNALEDGAEGLGPCLSKLLNQSVPVLIGLGYVERRYHAKKALSIWPGDADLQHIRA